MRLVMIPEAAPPKKALMAIVFGVGEEEDDGAFLSPSFSGGEDNVIFVRSSPVMVRLG